MLTTLPMATKPIAIIVIVHGGSLHSVGKRIGKRGVAMTRQDSTGSLTLKIIVLYMNKLLKFPHNAHDYNII